MSFTRFSIALMAVLLLALPSTAATIVNSDCGAACDFRAWAVGDLDQNGIPYFDNPSADGAAKNVGYFLTGTGGFVGDPNSPGSAIPFYGTTIASGGGAALNYYFNVSPIAGYTGALILEVAGFQNVNTFGWYVQGDRDARTQLLAGGDSAVTAVSFTPSANFGFYIGSGNGDFYFTESNLNGTAASANGSNVWQHMALFSDSASYWVGAEDSLDPAEITSPGDYGLRRGDFNDMVVRFSQAQVPEPSTWMLLGAGLVAIGVARKRRS